VILSSCHHVIMSLCHPGNPVNMVIMSSCHPVHPVILPSCSPCHPVILSSYHPGNSVILFILSSCFILSICALLGYDKTDNRPISSRSKNVISITIIAVKSILGSRNIFRRLHFRFRVKKLIWLCGSGSFLINTTFHIVHLISGVHH
jgi:hypothetical protein